MDTAKSVTDRTTLERISPTEILITRTFRAPARIVFDAWTRPELVRRWWAPASRGVTLTVCDAQVHAGGTYRYVIQRTPDEEYAFSGKYVEVSPPQRLVYTQTFEAVPDGAAVITVLFEEKAGHTTVRAREVYPSREALEMAISSGMEDGMRETYEQLAALVVSLL